ncbi:CC0125/CC1285 family lipoprotein [Hyphobacterium sp.]|uniref:CC0125/CC1285 family lipoprotein n=1 Tax=Hyphobacterium sp. TaxID=2004662 RepID=UPI003BA90CA6
MRKASIILVCSALMACAGGPTVYAPAHESNRGYSEQQIESDRFRVRFDGGSDVDYRELEDMVLRRAAELTLEQGGDWFIVVARSRDGDDRNPVRVGGSVGRSWGSRGYSGSGVGIGISLSPGAGDKSFSLEILIRQGQRSNEPDAYDARGVLAQYS